jgi:acetyltransferase-like isoleucine patch superfamily enzyme
LQIWARAKYGDDVEIGREVFWDAGVRLKVTDGARVVIGSGALFGRNVTLVAKHGVLEIGEKTFVGEGSVIVAGERIDIGKNCLIAEHVTIRDQDHGTSSSEVPMNEQAPVTAPVGVGDDVWIGAKATVTKGVRIGTGAIIGANAVVTRDVDPRCVALGVPAKTLRLR